MVVVLFGFAAFCFRNLHAGRMELECEVARVCFISPPISSLLWVPLQLLESAHSNEMKRKYKQRRQAAKAQTKARTQRNRKT